jgi:hypothetical protein
MNMKATQTDNVFFGMLTGFISTAMMLITCVTIAQVALRGPADAGQVPQVKQGQVNVAGELPATQVVAL